MRNSFTAVMTLAMLLVVAGSAAAQTPSCDKLPQDKKALARSILQSQHPYDCCDGTILECLKQKKVCSLAHRLAENICTKVAAGQNKQTIERELSRRARSMMPQKQVKIDLTHAPMAGEPSSPVILVEYACARCPYCSRMTPKLYDAVTKGRLKGKVRLYFRPFPIRGHEFSKETGLGFIAAIKLGRFWPFILHSYKHFDDFCIKKQTEWAVEAGMDAGAFNELLADPVTRTLLVESKKEGIVNKVDATPTFFIDGRKFMGEATLEELVDVLEEAYDKAKGKQYR